MRHASPSGTSTERRHGSVKVAMDIQESCYSFLAGTVLPLRLYHTEGLYCKRVATVLYHLSLPPFREGVSDSPFPGSRQSDFPNPKLLYASTLLPPTSTPSHARCALVSNGYDMDGEHVAIVQHYHCGSKKSSK